MWQHHLYRPTYLTILLLFIYQPKSMCPHLAPILFIWPSFYPLANTNHSFRSNRRTPYALRYPPFSSLHSICWWKYLYILFTISMGRCQFTQLCEWCRCQNGATYKIQTDTIIVCRSFAFVYHQLSMTKHTHRAKHKQITSKLSTTRNRTREKITTTIANSQMQWKEKGW